MQLKKGENIIFEAEGRWRSGVLIDGSAKGTFGTMQNANLDFKNWKGVDQKNPSKKYRLDMY